MNILAIGAHYDDIELGCGGTLLKHKRNDHNIFFAIIRSDETRTGSPNVRYREQLNAVKILDVPSSNLIRFGKDDSFSDIVGRLDLIEVDVIFTHFENDTHQHHRYASQIGQAVGRKEYITTAFYDSGSSYDFHPNVYSLIDMKFKLNLVNCFKTQIASGAINLSIAERKAAFYASLISTGDNRHAEGFVVRKMKWIV